MNRALKILSVAVILFLAYMWVSILYKSCNKTSEFDDFGEEVASDEEVPSLSNEYESDPFFADEGGDEESSDSESTNEDPIDYDKLDQKIEATQNEVPRTSTQNQTSKPKPSASPIYTGNSSGKYLVIAGSYILETNADVMLKKLNRLGYSNAEKVNFDLSEFHSVCAGRFDDYTEAVQVTSELKRRGVDCYVHTKK